MVCTNTLEDVVVAKDFESHLQKRESMSDSAVYYYDENMTSHMVGAYFDENNQAVKSQRQTRQKIKAYEKEVEEYLNTLE